MDSILKDINPVIQLLITMATFSLLPFIFVSMTPFLRFTIVFSMLKTAMGTNSVPPAITLIGLSLILTIYTMSPVFDNMYQAYQVPYQKNKNVVEALNASSKPLKEYMLKQTRQSDLAFFVEKTRRQAPSTPEELTLWEVAPAYIISELKTAFEIGFIIYVPFIVLDLVVANILLALGMFMLSPQIVSTPFKLLIFIAVDGWSLIVKGLVESFN
ncbi:MAG: EscR/YscR/HrcR family type III secretion system export apparatus protein [Candidatus Gastranaerophilales bacterium]|nr:EscR/YscR/HrcR family type III secretion system export apparatus protein [Candidatus Gastranaerophilales bacterium]